MKSERAWELKLIAAGNYMDFPDRPESGTIDASMLPRWKSVFDALKCPADTMGKFRMSYDQPSARDRREIAIVGIQEHADAYLSRLLGEAASFYERRQDMDADDAQLGALSIVDRFAALAARGDYRPFQRMAAIMQNGGARTGEKGGEYSIEGMVFDNFCRFICDKKTLPTKKQLRDSCGLSSDKKAKELFRIACKNLGLNGLPEGHPPL